MLLTISLVKYKQHYYTRKNMFCPRCGSQSSDNTVFCAYCGTRIDGNDRKEQLVNSQPQKQPGHGMAVASLVLGIIGIVLIGFVFGILAIIFGSIAKKQGYKGGRATAGLTLGIIALVLWAVVIGLLSMAG